MLPVPSPATLRAAAAALRAARPAVEAALRAGDATARWRWWMAFC